MEHRNVNNYIHGLNRRIFSQYEPPLNIGLQAPYTFDGFPQMVLGAMVAVVLLAIYIPVFDLASTMQQGAV